MSSGASLYLIDLPGYGYARASHSDRAGYAKLIKGRDSLARPHGVVWLLDIRHPPSGKTGTAACSLNAAPLLVALTKSNKVGRGGRAGGTGPGKALARSRAVQTTSSTGLGMRSWASVLAASATGTMLKAWLVIAVTYIMACAGAHAQAAKRV
jgi:GTP-binding protein